jgi:hypothetical protein
MKLNENVKYSNHISGFIAVCLFIVLPSFIIIHECSSPTAPPSPEQIAAKQQKMDSLNAREWAKTYVTQRLKSPKAAEFQNVLDFAVAPVKDKKGKPLKDVWEVSGYVDAQNSFGAMLRNNWYVKLVKQGDKWIPVKIVVGE